jgi:archaemetzincin
LGRSSARAFEPPDAEQRKEAIGPTKDLSPALQRALDPGQDFEPIEKPQKGDWLAAHPERAQSFADFLKDGFNRPEKDRTVVALLPIGKFPEEVSPSLDLLKEYAGLMFGLPVKLLPPLDLAGGAVTSRINPYTGKRQLLAPDILDLLKEKLPPDAYCLQAITMEDLYPEPSWNFVFGEASLRERVGVFSFARYDPAFFGEERGGGFKDLLLRRSLDVLVHEAGHMFGLGHCLYFRCVMNGSNHMQEADSRPMHLCPVCLRKLQHAVGFDVAGHYRGLKAFYQKIGFKAEAAFASKRLMAIEGK